MHVKRDECERIKIKDEASVKKIYQNFEGFHSISGIFNLLKDVWRGFLI